MTLMAAKEKCFSQIKNFLNLPWTLVLDVTVQNLEI